MDKRENGDKDMTSKGLGGGFRIVVVTCDKCGKDHYPYGFTPTRTPLYANLKCPSCGFIDRVILDKDIQNEIAKKTPRLESNAQIEALEIENRTLKAEIGSLRIRVEDLTDAWKN